MFSDNLCKLQVDIQKTVLNFDRIYKSEVIFIFHSKNHGKDVGCYLHNPIVTTSLSDKMQFDEANWFLKH